MIFIYSETKIKLIDPESCMKLYTCTKLSKGAPFVELKWPGRGQQELVSVWALENLIHLNIICIIEIMSQL